MLVILVDKLDACSILERIAWLPSNSLVLRTQNDWRCVLCWSYLHISAIFLSYIFSFTNGRYLWAVNWNRWIYPTFCLMLLSRLSRSRPIQITVICVVDHSGILVSTFWISTIRSYYEWLFKPEFGRVWEKRNLVRRNYYERNRKCLKIFLKLLSSKF